MTVLTEKIELDYYYHDVCGGVCVRTYVRTCVCVRVSVSPKFQTALAQITSPHLTSPPRGCLNLAPSPTALSDGSSGRPSAGSRARMCARVQICMYK